MEAFIFGVLVAGLLMLFLHGGRSEPRTIYIPITRDSFERDEYDSGGWGWVGMIPFVMILVVLFQALA